MLAVEGLRWLEKAINVTSPLQNNLINVREIWLSSSQSPLLWLLLQPWWREKTCSCFFHDYHHHVIFFWGVYPYSIPNCCSYLLWNPYMLSNFINALPCFDKILRHDAPCSTITTMLNTPKTFLEIIFRKYQALDLWNISMGFTCSMCRVFCN